MLSTIKKLFKKSHSVIEPGAKVNYLQHGAALVTEQVMCPSESVFMIKLDTLPEGFATNDVMAFDGQIELIG